MNHEGLLRRRQLPHLDVEGKPYFITACLAGSIPASGLSRIRDYRQTLDQRPKPKDVTIDEWNVQKQKRLFCFVDSLLDHESPVKHFQDSRLAEIVQNAFLYFADERYFLYAFVVMPSHHHWLFLPRQNWCESLSRRQTVNGKVTTPREVISQSIQSYTAH